MGWIFAVWANSLLAANPQLAVSWIFAEYTDRGELTAENESTANSEFDIDLFSNPLLHVAANPLPAVSWIFAG